MNKKLITACLALVAFAAMAVVPAFASASPVLQDSSGTVPVGAGITVTNVGNTIFTSNLGNVECNKVDLTGTVKENSGSSIKVEVANTEANVKSFTGTGTGGACTGTFGINFVVTTKPVYCVTSTGSDTGFVKNGACGKESGGPRFILESGSLVCEFERQTSGVGTPITGTYTTGTDEIQVPGTEAAQEFKLIRSEGLGCPSSGKLDATLTLETTVSPFDPVKIN